MPADRENEQFPGKSLGGGYYLVSDEELKGATIIRPGIYDPNDADLDTAPSEPILLSTVLKPVDVIIFYDKHSQYPLDETSGCNQWAFVVDKTKALYVRGWVRSIKLSDIPKLPNAIVIRRIPEPLAPYVARMLLEYRWRPIMFQVAVNHLQGNNYVPFLKGSFFPTDVAYANDEEYDQAWHHMVAKLEPRDAIFTFDRRSFTSKFIATATHGPFSHCAVYAGDGLISEIVTSGTRLVPIETYKGRHFRVAAYRHYGKAPNTVEEMIAEMHEADGRPGYSYFGAFKAGLRALIGRHRDALTPNSLILEGYITFIAQA
jgi:hypothetical protein